MTIPSLGEMKMDSSNASRAASRDHSLPAGEAEPAAAHTPGPWEVGDDGPILYDGMLRPVWNIYGGRGLRDGRLVASVEHFKEDDFPNANARLIAATPEMYEALKQAQSALAMLTAPFAILNTTTLHAWSTAVAAEVSARAAIAKATQP